MPINLIHQFCRAVLVFAAIISKRLIRLCLPSSVLVVAATFSVIGHASTENESIKAQIDRIKIKNALNIAPELRDQLDAQLQQVLSLRDTEDAYSEDLGETYYSYAEALKESGRIEEAREMYASALHIKRINSGVNGLEQRPILISMLILDLAQDNFKEAEDSLRRILWIERQHPDVRDTQSYETIILLANRLIDQFLYRPTATEASLVFLDKAINYLEFTVRRWGDMSLDELMLPYGELAYAQYLRYRLHIEMRGSYYQNRRVNEISPESQFKQDRVISAHTYGANRYMHAYLKKAESEKNPEHSARALLGLGDIALLEGRRSTAARYYELAWEVSQQLDENHEVVRLMSQAQRIPAFNYVLDRDDRVERKAATMFVPLEFSIDKHGKAKKIYTDSKLQEDRGPTIRARRVLKKLTFRPIIENGKPVEVERFIYPVQIRDRSKKKNKPSSAENEIDSKND